MSDPRPAASHLAAFIEQAWNPARERKPAPAEEVPAEWRAAWDSLQAASGLPPEEFFLFVQDCELDFGYHLPAYNGAASPDEQAIASDLAHLTYKLFETVADPARVIHLTRSELLARLGWLERYEFRSQHEFPVDESLYEPILASAGQLEGALGRLDGGYVGVFGSPGSGKSTLLTQTFRYRAGRVVRYYAFVPNVLDPFGRGESVNFLHDVVLAIERAGFQVGASASTLDRRQLRERFYRQLQLLHQNWVETGTKTTIMIDGLDHIVREQHPERSLLRDLPPPEQVPDGVFIVLGSQTDQLSDLPDGVQHAIRQPERRIEMQPLSRAAVFRITERVAESKVPITEQQKERIYELSAGHPLALIYISNRLRDQTDAAEVQAVLDTTERYEGSIERQYHSYWRQITDDEELMHLLGMLARLRRSLDLRWAEGWARRATVDRLRRLFAHYFRREGSNRSTPVTG
ncbi:MAG: ATP-binding protein [Acidobacteriota bacterium]|nr:ATP-binding protein [Acidobacteriota bacterium]